MTQPQRTNLAEAFQRLSEQRATATAGRANRNYISILKSLELLGISPHIEGGKLVVSMDELIRKEYEYMSGVDLESYGAEGVNGFAADTD